MNQAAFFATPQPMPLLEVRGLVYGYPGPDRMVDVLRGVDLSVASGEFIAILGPSGGGKSTLLNLIGGLERPKAGSITVNGRDITAMDGGALERYRQTDVAFVFQFFNLLPSLTAMENVLLGLEAMDDMPADAEERARVYLSEVGLDGKMDRFPSQLSGGEQQRVAIARALARHAPLILADEPTGNLDEDTAGQVMEMFAVIQRRTGTAVVLITHDIGVAARADRVLHLAHGRLEPARQEALQC